jgi:hypothetical protein
MRSRPPLAPLTHRWRVEPPPFADTAQRFYFLADAPRFFAVDCVVVSESGVAPLLERERHGEPLVYFDYAMLLDKELARGRPLEALGFYQALLRALLEVLGMAHRPDRFDFGWRYVESQLPEDARALLARYAFVADAQALRTLAPQLVAELLARLHEGARAPA